MDVYLLEDACVFNLVADNQVASVAHAGGVCEEHQRSGDGENNSSGGRVLERGSEGAFQLSHILHVDGFLTAETSDGADVAHRFHCNLNNIPQFALLASEHIQYGNKTKKLYF